MNLTSYYIAFHDPLWIVLLSSVLFIPVRKLISSTMDKRVLLLQPWVYSCATQREAALTMSLQLNPEMSKIEAGRSTMNEMIKYVLISIVVIFILAIFINRIYNKHIKS